MNPQIKRILKWAFFGFCIAAFIDVLISGGESFSIRVCFALMVGGAGAVTGALLCANFTADDEEHVNVGASHDPKAEFHQTHS